MKAYNIYQLILNKFIKKKLNGNFSSRYMSSGAQPTLLEELEKEFSLLSSKAEQALYRREEIHSHLSSDIQKTESLKALFQNMDLSASSGGKGEGSIIIDDRKIKDKKESYLPLLKNLRQKIEKTVTNEQLIGKSHKFNYLSKKSPPELEVSWLNHLISPQQLRTTGLAFAGLVIAVGIVLFDPYKATEQNQLPFLEAVQVYGSFTKNNRSLKAASLNGLTKLEKQNIFYINPGDEFETGRNSLSRIIFDDKTLIQFGPSTKLKLGLNQSIDPINSDIKITNRKFSKEFILERGIAHFFIPKQHNKNSYLVSGKGFSIQVFGTRFVLAQAEQYTRLILEEGRLLVTLFSKDKKDLISKKESFIIDKPYMIEIFSKSKKRLQVLKSPIDKEYLSFLGVFSKLDKNSGELLVNPKLNKEDVTTYISFIGSIPDYNPKATIGDLQRLQKFAKYRNTFPEKNNLIFIPGNKTLKVKKSQENIGEPSYYFEILDKGRVKKIKIKN